MASELGNIKDEDLLRKMWQETEDFGLKKEIRTHMYKLREARLKNFYVDEMDSKAPITSRHGNAMADQSFESLKSNEIRGTDSPMGDIKFGPIAGANTGGWNVISSSEMSSDGKARTEKMLATTEGVTPVDGGKKAFAGKNEELKTERFDGDANNFTYSTGESSNMTLNENIVTGDDNNKRVEKKSSSVTSSSKVVRSSANTGDVISHDDDYHKHLVHDHDLNSSSVNTEKHSSTTTSDYKSTTDNRGDNMKLSSDPARVKEAFRLAEQPGKILSRQVERANPTTNMITERKELTDGTIVTTKRYETINSDHVDIQATTRDNRSSSTNSNVKTHEINKSSQNVETNFKTSRDEEAFRLSQQPGTIISRNIEMTDPTTRMIIEKKELTDGTIVTTKRYEKVSSSSDHSSNVQTGKNITRENVDTQSTRNFSNDAKSTTSEDIRKTSTNETFKTSRDEEAFRLSTQPGRVISRDIEMINPTTRMITEKKELNKCGTVVTTRRYETISDDTQSTKSFTKEHNVDAHSKNLRNDSSKTEETRKTTQSVNQTFKTARDEEAFRLAQQPGTVISREVVNTNPTTRMITEKKELTDGTIVTTKRYETISDDTQSNKSFTSEQNFNANSNLRNDSTSKTEETKKTSQNVSQTYKTTRDEEAFRLAQQPGTVISREVVNTNPTTRMITEKKELTDGTIVTTKRFETISDKNETVSKNLNRENVETQNIKRTVTNSNTDVRRSTFDDQKSDKNVQREVVEEKITKKVYDTSCPCPEKHDEKTHAREFINKERGDDRYDVTSEIIVDIDQRDQRRTQDFTEIEKNREEIIRREQIKKLEQRRVEEQVRRQEQSTKKITRELDTDAAHKAFASSLRCVTPPNERVSTPSSSRNDNRSNRSPSRDTTISKISSSTTTIRKSSNHDVSKNDRRSSTKSASPEKHPRKVNPDSRRSTTEFVETIEIDTKNRYVSPQKGNQSSPRAQAPSKPDTSNKSPQRGQPNGEKNVPKKTFPDSRDTSPQKQTPRDGSPTKHHPSANVSSPKVKSPQKQVSSPISSREVSPTKHYPSSNVSTPRGTSPQKSYPASGSSTPRGTSPQKYPASQPTSRDVSPNKTTSTKTTKRDDAYDEIFSSTIVIDNKEKRFKDDIKVVQNIDTKNMSATTSVSDLEYIIPSERHLYTNLDNDLEIRVNLSNFNETDDLQIKTTVSEINDESKKKPSKKPDDKKPFNRSETFEERARKLIGVTPDDTTDDKLPHYAKPTYASLPVGSSNRVSEIRERKAKIEKEVQDIEQVSVDRRKSTKSETEDFITREKTESRRSTHVYSSPDQSPTRPNTKPANKKPTETKKTQDRSIDKEEVIKTNATKTNKTSEPRHTSPEKKKPSTVDSTRTSQKVTSEQTSTNKRVTSEREPVRTRSPVRQKSPETHVTVAKINISPVRGVTNKTTKTTVVETSKNVKVAPSIRLIKRPTSEPDSDIETDQELIKNIDKASSKTTRKKLIQSRKDSAPVHKTTVTSNKEKVSRSVSENIFKSDVSTTIKKKTTTSKDVAQPKESSPKKDTKRPTKCVTTKTINLTNVSAINSNTLDDVLIDAQQAKSSREPSPDKIVPTPVRHDEDLNGHELIYPNKVTEPEDGKKQKPKVKNIPIFEEKTKQFVGLEITEIETDKSQIILEEDELEEHESSVINSSTLERCDRKRNSVQIDPLDDEDDDQDYLLSVSQKVNKFISTAEELKKPKTSAPFDSTEVKLEDVSEPEDDSMLTVNRKVSKFSTTTDESLKHDKKTKKTVENIMSRSVDEVDENLENDECLLSVSDKVNKFITSAEKLKSSTPQKSPELVKNFMKSTTTSRAGSNVEDVNETFLTKEKTSSMTREDREKSESRTTKSSTSDITLKSTEAIKRARAVFENNTSTRDVKRHDDILSRPSVWEGKRTPTAERKVYKETKTSRVESKSPSPTRDKHSPTRQAKSPAREKQSPGKDYASSSPSPTSPRRGSHDKTPVYMRDQVSTKKDLFEKRISSSKLEMEMNQRKSLSPQNSYEERNRAESEDTQHHNVTRRTSSDKHYMSHTVASLEHVSSERKESELHRTSRHDSGSRHESGTSSPAKYHRNISESTNDSTYDSPRTPTKFGVELKRTDSGKQVRRTSTNAETINIEEIFDLAELEKLLEVVVGYEQRRRIRAQIRIVRRIISERQTSSENQATKTTVESKTTSERKANTESKNCIDTRTVRNDKTTTSSSSYSSPTRKARDEPLTLTKVTKTVVEKPGKISGDSRVQRTITTTTTTTTSQSLTDKPREVTQTKTTRVSNDKTSTPSRIIESLNKNSKAKATENVVKTVKKTSATSNTQKTNSTRDSRTDTDYLSYGIGPTDSDGLPLVGLKALKKKSPASTTTSTKESKTSGTIISEVSYSENGRPAVVERKTTKYSTDPSDFSHETDSDYKTSTSEKKSSRGGVYSVSKLEKFQDDGKTSSTASPKFIRRGSVKELKEKFVRKDSSSKVTESSSRTDTKRTSGKYHDSESESESFSVSKQCKTSSKETKSFLNSEKKASNVNEVLNYMRNADHVQKDGDSKDDAEARALLNKFLGATALMTGIENNSGLSKEFLSRGGSSTKNQRASSGSKVTKTVTSYSTGKAYDINDIWDVDLLKKLLEATTNYEERRKIRTRLRQVMADKEACADIVKQLTAELDPESGASTSEKKEEGESLLLPLIQGILQNPKYHNLSARQLLSLNLSKTISQQSGLLPPSSSSSKMNSEHKQLNASNRLGNDCLPIEDSGTESGEDLRLLAAGLHSNLNKMDLGETSKEIPDQAQSPKAKNEALAAGLLAEVTTALARLQNSINQGEIDLDDSKKTALLSLVNRLQLGLVSPDKITDKALDNDSPLSVNGFSPVENPPDVSERRGSSGGIGRFAKRRNRNSRHTVGVTREELADARRIIEELEIIGMQNSISNLSLNKPKITATVVNSKPGVYNAILTRQISEPITLLRPSQFVPKGPIKEIEIFNKPRQKILFKQVSLDQPISILKNPVKVEVIPKIEDKPTPFKRIIPIQRNPSGSNSKFYANKANDDDAPTDESSSSDDDDEVVNNNYFNNSAAAKFKAKENYLRNQQPVERSLNYSSGDETCAPGQRVPKYTSKKMKMKRANTVDIPKSYSFVNTFNLDKDCSDDETAKNTYHNKSRGSNAGLRTTITGGSGSTNLPPQFTPKTENDKKFLAFIQKQTSNVTPSYVNPSANRNATKTHNWTNKFGNLKNRFENDDPPMPAKPPLSTGNNSAAKFWKNAEKEKPSAMVSPLPPVPVVPPLIKALPLVSEKFPWKNPGSDKIYVQEEKVILRKKPMLDKFVPKQQSLEMPRVVPEPNKLPILKPSNINNFSHAPMSVFKPPISRKLSNSFKPIHTTEEVVRKPLPQVSNGLVKQLAETGYNVNNNPVPQTRKIILSSPTRIIADSSFVKATKPLERAELGQPVPWKGKPKSENVVNIATLKFEQNTPTIRLSAQLQPQSEPVIKYRNNPLYSGTPEKRASLPPKSFNLFEPSMYSFNGSSHSQSIENISKAPKESTFVITDYTQPSQISTFAPSVEKSSRPTFSRQESLTNPDLEPLVLTSTRTVFSPNEKPKPMELYDIATPSSSQMSKDHSKSSLCDDLDNELENLGDSVECKVAVSRVMKGPVAQTAYTQSSDLTSLHEQGKENSMMKSLQDSLKKLSQKSPTPEKRQVDVKRLSQESSNSSLDMKPLSPFKMASHSLSQDSSNSSIDSAKLPPFKIPVPAVPETAYSITYASPPHIQVKSPSTDPPPHVLFNNTANQSQGYRLQKASSSNSLAIPKPTDPPKVPQRMYGVPQSTVVARQKTVQAYFGPKRAESLSIRQQSTSSYVRPVTFSSPSQVTSVTRKISMYSKPVTTAPPTQALHSLARSRTLPSMANVELLDESNIDDAFEELLSSTNL